MSDRGERRQLIVSKYLEVPNTSFTFIAQALNFLRAIVGEVINRYKQTLMAKTVKGGRKKRFVNKLLASKVIASVKTNPNRSIKELVKEYVASKIWIHRLIGCPKKY